MYICMIILAISSVVVYLYYMIILGKALNENDQKVFESKKKCVSVVVAARNEEKNIGNLLFSLVNQSYPKDLYEVIVANDGSTDNTENILKEYGEKFPFVKYINIQGRENVKSPKKNALDQAIKSSKGEIILTTDADCFVNREWIESMVSCFVDDTEMVVGFTRTHIKDWGKASLLEKFEHFDFFVLMMIGMATVVLKKNFACNGQNLAYRKKSFEEVGGFNKIKHLVSGDDSNLMQLFRINKKKIGYNSRKNSYVFTGVISSWRALINQRNRWSSNIFFQIRLNPEFFCYLTALFLNLATMFYFFFVDIRFFLFIYFTKLITEWIFVKYNSEMFLMSKERLSFYLFWFSLQPFFNFVVTIFGFFQIYKWEVKR